MLNAEFKSIVELQSNIWLKKHLIQIQSNLSNTDTEGTEQSVRIREVSAV